MRGRPGHGAACWAGPPTFGTSLGEVGGYQDDLLVAKAAVSCRPLRGLRQFLDPVMWVSWSVGTQKSVYVLSWPGGVWACVCLADPVGAVAPGGTWSLCWARASPWGPCLSLLVPGGGDPDAGPTLHFFPLGWPTPCSRSRSSDHVSLFPGLVRAGLTMDVLKAQCSWFLINEMTHGVKAFPARFMGWVRGRLCSAGFLRPW